MHQLSPQFLTDGFTDIFEPCWNKQTVCLHIAGKGQWVHFIAPLILRLWVVWLYNAYRMNTCLHIYSTWTMSGCVDQGNYFFHLSGGPVAASFNDCIEFSLQIYNKRQGGRKRNQASSLVLSAVTAAHSSSLLSYLPLFLLSVTLEAQPWGNQSSDSTQSNLQAKLGFLIGRGKKGRGYLSHYNPSHDKYWKHLDKLFKGISILRRLDRKAVWWLNMNLWHNERLLLPSVFKVFLHDLWSVFALQSNCGICKHKDHTKLWWCWCFNSINWMHVS